MSEKFKGKDAFAQVREDKISIFQERLSTLCSKYQKVEFSEKTGISRVTIDRYLKGEALPSCEALITISQKCNVSVDWLLGISEIKAVGNLREACEFTGLSESAMKKLSLIKNSLGGSFLETADTFISSIYFNRLIQAMTLLDLACCGIESIPKELKSKDDIDKLTAIRTKIDASKYAVYEQAVLIANTIATDADNAINTLVNGGGNNG